MIPRTRGPRDTFRRNSLAQYGLQIAKYLFPYVTLPYLARVLGTEGYAIRAYVLAAMVFAQICVEYGFNLRGTEMVVACRGDRERIGQAAGAIMQARGISIVLVGIGVALATSFVPILRENAIYVALAYSAVILTSLMPDFILIGLQQLGPMTSRFVFSKTISVMLTFILVRSAGDLLWVPALDILAALLAFVWSWWVVMSRFRVRLRAAKMGAAWLAVRGATVYFVSTLATTAFNSLTTVMIGLMVSDRAEIAYWSLAMTAVGAVQSLYTPITNSLYPHMLERRDVQLVKQILTWGVPLVALVFGVFVLQREFIMSVLGGSEYLEGADLLAYVAPVVLFSFPAMILGFPVLGATGNVKAVTSSSVIASIFHMVGLGVLVATGHFGLLAVAALRSSTEVVLLGVRVIMCVRCGSLRHGGRDGFRLDMADSPDCRR